MDPVDQLILNLSRILAYTIVPISVVVAISFFLASTSKDSKERDTWRKRAKNVTILLVIVAMICVGWVYLVGNRY